MELEQYKEIIYSKINDILMGNNKLLTKLFGEEYGYYVKLIVNVLKDGKKIMIGIIYYIVHFYFHF